MCSRANEAIVFPRDLQLESVAGKINDIAGFPNVIGCIDGTHFAIKCPSVDEPAFVNRKGFHSLNVQCISDADMALTDVVVKFPGSNAHAFIFNQSSIKARLESGEFSDMWRLGDSGYALRNYLLTPFSDPLTVGDKRYDSAHERTRVLIERAFGTLESRFLCLSHKMTEALPLTAAKRCQITVACIGLHHKARRLKLPDEPVLDIEHLLEDDSVRPESDNNINTHTRNKVVFNYFS